MMTTKQLSSLTFLHLKTDIEILSQVAGSFDLLKEPAIFPGIASLVTPEAGSFLGGG